MMAIHRVIVMMVTQSNVWSWWLYTDSNGHDGYTQRVMHGHDVYTQSNAWSWWLHRDNTVYGHDGYTQRW